MLIKTLQVMG